MLSEYGIDPQLVPIWANSRVGTLLKPLFGVSSGRLVSRFPKDWNREVRRLWEQEVNPTKKKQIEVLLNHLSSKFISRNREGYLASRSWLENAEIDDARIPFKKILATENPRTHHNVLPANEISEELLIEFSQRENTFYIPKNTEAMVQLLGPVLRAASEVKFIDKNFFPANERFTVPLVALLKAARLRRPGGPLSKIEYHVEYEYRGDHQTTRRLYLEELPHIIPIGANIEIFFWSEQIQWGLHNRYILTDVGGFHFGAGLDNSPPRQDIADTVSRLDGTSFSTIYTRFSTNSQNPVITLRDRLLVSGCASQ